MNNLTTNEDNRDLSTRNRGDFHSLINHFWSIFDSSHHPEFNNMEPKIEVSDNKNAVTVTAEMPGVNEKDIDLQISSDGYLTISGEKRHENKEETNGNYFSEIYYGQVSRTVPLPGDLNYDNADAEFNDGILRVSIPKAQIEKQKVKKISVKKNKA